MYIMRDENSQWVLLVKLVLGCIPRWIVEDDLLLERILVSFLHRVQFGNHL